MGPRPQPWPQAVGRDCTGPSGALMESTADKEERSAVGQSGAGVACRLAAPSPKSGFLGGGAQGSLGSWSIHIDSGSRCVSKAGHRSPQRAGGDAWVVLGTSLFFTPVVD